MNLQKDNRLILGRRNFILAALLFPFLSRLTAYKFTNGTLSLNEEQEFIILGGWVLLKDDLIEKLN